MSFTLLNYRLKKKVIKQNIFYNNFLKSKKIPFFLYYYFKTNNKDQDNNILQFDQVNPLFVYKKSIKILKFFSGFKCLIHTGRVFKSLILRKRYSGFKIGEFIFTRRFGKGDIIHSNKKKLKLNKLKKR